MTAKGYKVKSAKEKGAWTKSEGKQAQVSKSSVLVESYRTCLIPPALTYDNMGVMLSTRKGHWRVSAQWFYRGLVT